MGIFLIILIVLFGLFAVFEFVNVFVAIFRNVKKRKAEKINKKEASCGGHFE